jgi:hypothetical protein
MFITTAGLLWLYVLLWQSFSRARCIALSGKDTGYDFV